MAALRRLTFALLLSLLAPAFARATLLPNGDVAWGFQTSSFVGSLVWAQGGTTGTAALWNRSNGRGTVASFASLQIFEGQPGDGDSLTAYITFDVYQLSLVMGFGFAGGPLPPIEFGYLSLFGPDTVVDNTTGLPPVDLPPVSAFGIAKLDLPYFGVGGSGQVEQLFFTQTLTQVPEPESLWLLVLGGLACGRPKENGPRRPESPEPVTE